MYAVLLAGGSGTRLWPLSRALFPKQCADLLGSGRSLLQDTAARAAQAVSGPHMLVVAHAEQAEEIRRQLGFAGIEGVRVLEEPLSRNTAPAIALAAWHLLRTAGEDVVMAVLPSDHLISDHAGFAELLRAGETAARRHGLVTFGIRPDSPETGYGYIRTGAEINAGVFAVEAFVEKPDLTTAQKYVADGRCLWNSGMFVFCVGALIEQYRLWLPDMHAAFSRLDYDSPESRAQLYSEIDAVSIDYGILERAGGLTVLPTAIGWSDLGSWDACCRKAARDADGNALTGRVCALDTQDTMIRAGSRFVGAVGLKNMVVVDTPDALLVCDRACSQDVKKITERLLADGAPEAREHRTIHAPWGSHTCLEAGAGYQVKRICVNPGARLSLQSHRHRSENWVVAEGRALVTIDGRRIRLDTGGHVTVPLGAHHRIENDSEYPLTVIEVQKGEYLGEDDIIRYEDDYGRCP